MIGAERGRESGDRVIGAEREAERAVIGAERGRESGDRGRESGGRGRERQREQWAGCGMMWHWWLGRALLVKEEDQHGG